MPARLSAIARGGGFETRRADRHTAPATNGPTPRCPGKIMATSTSSKSKKVVYAAVVGNAMVAVTKLVAAFVTGSSSMLSESVHSFVDTGNETLLLYGY